MIRELTALGHDAVRSPVGETDENVYARALKESRILLTNDTDFLDTAKFSLAKTPGRVVFRVFPATFLTQRARIEALLIEYSRAKDFRGLLIELETGAIVARDA